MKARFLSSFEVAYQNTSYGRNLTTSYSVTLVCLVLQQKESQNILIQILLTPKSAVQSSVELILAIVSLTKVLCPQPVGCSHEIDSEANVSLQPGADGSV